MDSNCGLLSISGTICRPNEPDTIMKTFSCFIRSRTTKHSSGSVKALMDPTACRRYFNEFSKSASDSLKLASSHANRRFCSIRRAGRSGAAERLVVLLLVTMAAAPVTVGFVNFLLPIRGKLMNESMNMKSARKFYTYLISF